MTISQALYSSPVIAPSLLKCDFGDLQGEITRLDETRSNWLHWDVMDGHFVPNLSYGAMVIASLRSRTKAFFDAHLMISDPEKYLDDYIKAGCDALTIHIEADPQPSALLRRIRAAGRQAGIAINPKTPVEQLEPVLQDCDLILVMSVEPGFGGQKFMPEVLKKADWLRPRMAPGTRLSIDGGIAPETIGTAHAAGFEIFVAGSAIFDHSDYGAAIANLQAHARAGKAN